MEASSPEQAKVDRKRLARLLLLSLGGIGILFVLGRSCGAPKDGEEGKKALAGNASAPGPA